MRIEISGNAKEISALVSSLSRNSISEQERKEKGYVCVREPYSAKYELVEVG